MKKWPVIAGMCFGLSLLCLSPVSAQTYPNRPIRLVVGFPPGGGADLIARVFADQLGQKLNTPVIVVNMPGAGSGIGAAYVAKAASDGYTLFMSTSSLTINPSIYRSVNYDPIKDFVPIAKIGTSPFYVVVDANSKFKTLGQVLDAAKSRPGQLTYASGGVGSVGNLAAELLKSQAGVDFLHVPFKGLAPAVNALLGGTVDMSFSDLAPSIGLIKAGKLRALATTGPSRSQWLPDVPAVAESGLPSYSVELWYGLFAPAGTPDQVVQALHRNANALLTSPSEALKDRYNTLGVNIAKPGSQEEFSKFVRADVALWRGIVTKAGIKE